MISVIIPAYNEENSIGDTIRKILSILNQSSCQPTEVIVVDDGSTDDTLKEAAMAGARIIRHPHNIGYGRSLKDGIKGDCLRIQPAKSRAVGKEERQNPGNDV